MIQSAGRTTVRELRLLQLLAIDRSREPTAIVCLALTVALVALMVRIASVW